MTTKLPPSVRLPWKIWYQVLVSYLANYPVTRSQHQSHATGKNHRARPVLPPFSLYCPGVALGTARTARRDRLADILFVLLLQDTYYTKSCLYSQERSTVSASKISIILKLPTFTYPVCYRLTSAKTAASSRYSSRSTGLSSVMSVSPSPSTYTTHLTLRA